MSVKYDPIHEITMYQARCTGCGHIEDDYGDFTAWTDPGTPIEDVVENRDWFAKWRPVKHGTLDQELELLLCPECQHCEVCQSEFAYSVDGHLVCEDHEDHNFKEDAGDDGERSPRLSLSIVRDDQEG